MKVHELFNRVEWTAVEAALLLHYPDQASSTAGYRLVLDQMLVMEPQPAQDRILAVEPFYDEDDPDKPEGDCIPADVSCTGPDDDQHYGVGFTARAKVLDMTVQPQQQYSEAEMVAHILWETTWYGFDEASVQERWQAITESAAKIKNYTEEEREENLIPWDKVKARLAALEETNED